MKINRSLMVFFIGALLSTGASQANTDIEWCTYLGGWKYDEAEAIALDPEGNVYVTGHTGSFDFPTSAGAYDPTWNGKGDAFVAKLDPSGSRLLYSTFLGGNNVAVGRSIAVDSERRACVAGFTMSLDFPVTTGSFQTVHGFDGSDNHDGFVTKLSESGGELIFSTFIGGKFHDWAHGIALDGNGNIYVTGSTDSPDFPITAGAYDTDYASTQGFVIKLNPTGTDLVYSTFLGSQYTICKQIAIDSVGNAYITGHTDAADFPVTPGAFDKIFDGHEDAFITKLNPSGSALIYSSFLGGSWGEPPSGIAVDDRGNAYVCGWTDSPDFPITPGAFDAEYEFYKGFATKFNAWGSALIYSTFVGHNIPRSIAVDSEGYVYIAGEGGMIAKLNKSGTDLISSTILGGPGNTLVTAIVIGAEGCIYVAGKTYYDVAATPGAFDTSLNGECDAFVAKLRPHAIAASHFWPLYH